MMEQAQQRYKYLLVYFVLLVLIFLLPGCSTSKVQETTGTAVKGLSDEEIIEIIGEDWFDASPALVLSQWKNSKHGQNEVSCSTCHGNYTGEVSKPSATTCSSCHKKEYDEFSASTHSTAIVHAMSKDKSVYNGVEVDYKWQAYPEGGPDKWGCANCHSVGYVAENGDLGDCSSCHSGHSYNLEVARSPETCNGCHAGPGHPQYEAYVTSTHGKIWTSSKGNFDLTGSSEDFWARQETNPIDAPLCVTCHMPQGSHNTANGMAHDLYGKRVEDYEQQTAYMVNNSCVTCHSESFALEWLSNADEIASYTLGRLREAKAMLEEAKKDGLIRPTMEVTNSHPIAGQLSAAESLFFNVNMATNRARKGAYHMSSQYAGRQGWTDQSFALMEFRSEIERLRSIKE